MQRKIFFISDGTGITAETLGHTLMTQFPEVQFSTQTMPYVDSPEKLQQAIQIIDETNQHQQSKPIVVATLIDTQLRAQIHQCQALVIDVLASHLHTLSQELNLPVTPSIGLSHGMGDFDRYHKRIDAVNFALSHDDGLKTGNYTHADIILTGVSRSGKTPTCLYLALQYGIFAANYPLTPEELAQGCLPQVLQTHRAKLFGLTISVERLHAIRQERRPHSTYAALKSCQQELKQLSYLYTQGNISYLDTTHYSIEEIATRILSMTHLMRRI
jgi:regulator of PEP synthase PpsR (kinase-PPPase family)